MELDKETQAQLHRARAFSRLIEHEAWPEMKAELFDILSQYHRIDDIDTTKSPEDVRFEVRVRKEITSIMYNWVQTVESKGQPKKIYDRKSHIEIIS